MDSVPDPDFFLSNSINLFYTSKKKKRKTTKKYHMHPDFDTRLHSSLVQKGKLIETIHKYHCLKMRDWFYAPMSHRQLDLSSHIRPFPCVHL